MDDSIKEKLFHNSKENYGGNYFDHLLEQYKITVQMADNISERRSKTNTFFLSVNSFLLTALGISTKIDFNIDVGLWWLYVASAGGITFALTWFVLIRSYKKLNSGKFEVIHELEKKLPAAPYLKEWDIIRGEGVKKKYQKLTNIESIVPFIFIGLYVALSLGTSIFITNTS